MSNKEIETDIRTIRESGKFHGFLVAVSSGVNDGRKKYNYYEIVFNADEVADLIQAIFIEKVLE